MLNINAYSDQITAFIMSDLKANPLGKGEKLNLIGYSGGGQVGFNVADKLADNFKVDNMITLGSPYMEFSRNNINQVTHFSSVVDEVKWGSFFGVPAIVNLNDLSANSKLYKHVQHSGLNSYLNNSQVIEDVSNIIR